MQPLLFLSEQGTNFSRSPGTGFLRCLTHVLVCTLWLILVLPATAQTPEEVIHQMRPASGIEQEPKSLWHSWAGWVLVVGVALLAGSLGVAVASWLARRKTTLSGPLAAHQVALKELARIEALNLPAQGELERYHTELSNLMRHYLEQRFQLAATRQTTVEFLESMRSANCLTADQQAMLRAFLEQCDLAKFARLPPTVEQSVALANAVRRFLQQTASAPPGAVR